MKKIKKLILKNKLVVPIALGLLAIGAFLLLLTFINSNKNTVKIGKCKFIVEYADTEEKRVQGLSGQETLANNEGMLFVYENPGIYKFWMKDMNFGLDYVWILDNMVVDISENIPAPTGNNIPRISPKTPVDKVLEINAGKVGECSIKIGDIVN